MAGVDETGRFWCASLAIRETAGGQSVVEGASAIGTRRRKLFAQAEPSCLRLLGGLEPPIF
jgi:hypothetical protein